MLATSESVRPLSLLCRLSAIGPNLGPGLCGTVAGGLPITSLAPPLPLVGGTPEPVT